MRGRANFYTETSSLSESGMVRVNAGRKARAERGRKAQTTRDMANARRRGVHFGWEKSGASAREWGLEEVRRVSLLG